VNVGGALRPSIKILFCNLSGKATVVAGSLRSQAYEHNTGGQHGNFYKVFFMVIFLLGGVSVLATP